MDYFHEHRGSHVGYGHYQYSWSYEVIHLIGRERGGKGGRGKGGGERGGRKGEEGGEGVEGWRKQGEEN